MFLDFRKLSAKGLEQLQRAVMESGGDSVARTMLATFTPSSVQLTDYNTAIPLNGSYAMTSHVIDAATVFTPQTARVAGSSCYVRLISDGVHLPTFAVMAEHGSSAGWDGTPGAVNLVTFWFDGVQVLYSISQTIGGSLSAVVQKSTVSYQTPKIMVIDFTVPISNTVIPSVSTLSIANTGGSDTITKVEVIGGALVITKSRETQPTDVMTVSYNAPNNGGLVDNNGSTVASFSTRPVTYVAAPPPANYIRLENLNGLVTESGNATNGWNYSATGMAAIYATPRAVAYSNKVIPANQDGFLQMTVQALADYNCILALTDRIPPSGYPDFYLGMYTDKSHVGYQPFFNYANYGSDSAVAAVGDVIRIRRTGTTGYFEVSKDGGATFTTSAQVNNISQMALHPAIQIGDPAAGCLKLTGSSNIA